MERTFPDEQQRVEAKDGDGGGDGREAETEVGSGGVADQLPAVPSRVSTLPTARRPGAAPSEPRARIESEDRGRATRSDSSAIPAALCGVWADVCE